MSLPLHPAVPAKIHLLQKRRLAIRHAQFLCARYEQTKECAIAWDYVDDITQAIHKLDKRVIECSESPIDNDAIHVERM